MIELKNLQKVVGSTTVLDIDRLVVSDGEVTAILAGEGGGRDELVSLLLGQARPTAGTVSVAGFDPVLEKEAAASHLGVLFNENALYERLTARMNLVFYCRLRGLPTRRADEVLEEVGISDHASIQAGKLSPALARRLAFGRAILNRPSALILIHPFASSDSSSSALMDRLIRREADRGAAILIFAPEGAGLVHLCKTIYLLEQGRLTRTDYQADARRLEMPFKVPARQEGQVALINLPEILYASTEESQTLLHTVQAEIPSHLTLSELEERLVPHGFFRAHRGFLVNLQRVKSIIPYTRDSFTLILDDPAGTEIPLSKSAAKELREMLGY